MIEYSDIVRAKCLIDKIISAYELDLKGMHVLTEVGTNAYLFTSLIAACAGAQVKALSLQNDRLKEEIKEDLAKACTYFEVQVDLIAEKCDVDYQWADIITNTGSLRPFDRTTLKSLRATAVIPLMWETWEWRPEELDLQACQDSGILCLGTNESSKPLEFGGYLAATVLKLIFELELEVYKTNILLIGSGLGAVIFDSLKSFSMNVKWVANDSRADCTLDHLIDFWKSHGSEIDAIIMAEHCTDELILGDGGLVTASDLYEQQPAIRIGVISGNVETTSIIDKNIRVFPKNIKSTGYMSYQPANLGLRAVLELFGAGLRVGEKMAKSRQAGFSPEAAAKKVLCDPLAMDFPSPNAWVK
jgi:hypothetical protein